MGIKAVATPQAREAARRVNAAKADARAAALAPVIGEIRARGIITPYAIAAALTARGIPTARGHHRCASCSTAWIGCRHFCVEAWPQVVPTQEVTNV